MRDLSDEPLVLRSRTARFAREHGQTPQNFAFAGKYRCGPARAQPMRQRQITIIVPQRVGSGVADDDRPSEIGGSPARTRFRANGSAVKCTVVAGRKAGGRAMPKP